MPSAACETTLARYGRCDVPIVLLLHLTPSPFKGMDVFDRRRDFEQFFPESLDFIRQYRWQTNWIEEELIEVEFAEFEKDIVCKFSG